MVQDSVGGEASAAVGGAPNIDFSPLSQELARLIDVPEARVQVVSSASASSGPSRTSRRLLGPPCPSLAHNSIFFTLKRFRKMSDPSVILKGTLLLLKDPVWFKNRRAKWRRHQRALRFRNVPPVAMVPPIIINLGGPYRAVLNQERPDCLCVVPQPLLLGPPPPPVPLFPNGKEACCFQAAASLSRHQEATALSEVPQARTAGFQSPTVPSSTPSSPALPPAPTPCPSGTAPPCKTGGRGGAGSVRLQGENAVLPGGAEPQPRGGAEAHPGTGGDTSEGLLTGLPEKRQPAVRRLVLRKLCPVPALWVEETRRRHCGRRVLRPASCVRQGTTRGDPLQGRRWALGPPFPPRPRGRGPSIARSPAPSCPAPFGETVAVARGPGVQSFQASAVSRIRDRAAPSCASSGSGVPPRDGGSIASLRSSPSPAKLPAFCVAAAVTHLLPPRRDLGGLSPWLWALDPIPHLLLKVCSQELSGHRLRV
ncbi:PREDICTED: uncharacterized protein LOC101379536 [Odobenus rosmarus divergens]|uniref:Uncharacterized protein LOC101379536 n=1 Tax=Odobenus rosmarus divergens TaxID=9708 RepID=A0A9B0GXI0_ODORO